MFGLAVLGTFSAEGEKNQIHRAAATSSLPSLAQVLMAQLKLYPRPGEQVWEPQGRTAPAKSPP